MKISSTSDTMSGLSGRKCPRCAKKSIILDDSAGEIFCNSCGYVVSEDIRQELDDLPNSPSSVVSDIGSATINPKDKDAHGKNISKLWVDSIKRTSKLDSRAKTHSSTEKNLKQARIEIDKLKDKLALSDAIIEKTEGIYKKAIDRKLVRGYSIKGLICACLYVSCKNLEMPRTMKEICDTINIKEIEVSRCYKLIVREFNLQIPVIDPIKYIPKIASALGVSEKTKQRAISILSETNKAGTNVGKETIGIVAGALYLAGIYTKELKSQKEIAEASGVTEVIIRKRCKDIIKIIDWKI